jgi:hypothetical protein
MLTAPNSLVFFWLYLGWMLFPASVLLLIDYWLYQSFDKRVCLLAILLVLLLCCCGFYQVSTGY